MHQIRDLADPGLFQGIQMTVGERNLPQEFQQPDPLCSGVFAVDLRRELLVIHRLVNTLPGPFHQRPRARLVQLQLSGYQLQDSRLFLRLAIMIHTHGLKKQCRQREVRIVLTTGPCVRFRAELVEQVFQRVEHGFSWLRRPGNRPVRLESVNDEETDIMLEVVPKNIPVAISSCLIGEPVRFNGEHKRSRYITDVLAGYFRFQPICPEVGIGMGIPRPPVRVVAKGKEIRVRGVRDPELDVTRKLEDYADEKLAQLTGICGYILKKGSPSCGMERVRIYSADTGNIAGSGAGLYAGRIMAALGNVPFEEEGRLNDPVLRENFLCRVFTYARWQSLFESGQPDRLIYRNLEEFHRRHKLLVMSHNHAAYRRLGQIVANARPVREKGKQGQKMVSNQVAQDYLTELMSALRWKATRKKHTNVLQHLLGYLKRTLASEDKASLLASIENYRLGKVPLIVPVTLLSDYFRRYPDAYVSDQIYWQPYPAELGLRNDI